MKIMRLCSLLLLAICLAGVSYAQDTPNQDSPKAKASKMKSSKPQSDILAAQVAGGAEDRLVVDMNMKPDTPDSLDNSNTNTCAYMRTYRVKRQRGSDAVAPAGYTTCVPTRRFEMRSAVETRTDSGSSEK
jgi:hypothetical protein